MVKFELANVCFLPVLLPPSLPEHAQDPQYNHEGTGHGPHGDRFLKKPPSKKNCQNWVDKGIGHGDVDGQVFESGNI